LSEARIGEALCATSYGPSGKIASLHLGFPDRDLGPEETRAIQLAGLILTERLIELGDLPDPPPFHLTAREQDSLRLVAEGKTDWEVSVILGISESTARFHIDNARRKLGAVSRSQAVAKLIYRHLA
jgi:LuxR family quorum sensing-dependent transcriptional regulator